MRSISSAIWLAGTLILEQDLFGQNQTNCHPATNAEGVVFETRQCLESDPLFRDPSKRDFVLAAGSPARRDKIGAANPIPFASPWPLQPEELTMIPVGNTRDSRAWKDPQKTPRQSQANEDQPDP